MPKRCSSLLTEFLVVHRYCARSPVCAVSFGALCIDDSFVRMHTPRQLLLTTIPDHTLTVGKNIYVLSLDRSKKKCRIRCAICLHKDRVALSIYSLAISSSMPASVPATISSVSGCVVTDVMAEVTGTVTAEGNDDACHSVAASLKDAETVWFLVQPAYTKAKDCLVQAA